MPGRKISPASLAIFEEQLRLMLGVLKGDMSQLEAEAMGQALADHQGDDGGSYAQEFSLELLERDEATAEAIVEALARIEDLSFGRCVMCEQWILIERLRAMPHAECCISCQRDVESYDE